MGLEARGQKALPLPHHSSLAPTTGEVLGLEPLALSSLHGAEWEKLQPLSVFAGKAVGLEPLPLSSMQGHSL